MRHGNLREAHFPRRALRTQFVFHVAIAVQKHDGTGTHAIFVGGLQSGSKRGLVQRLDDLAACSDAFRRLEHPLVQQLGKHDAPVEQSRPRLSRDPQRVAETARDDQQRALALALQQRIRGDGRAHLHAGHALCRDQFAGLELEQPTDALNRGIRILRRVLRQQLVRVQLAVRRTSDDVGKRAAPIDPELPARHLCNTQSGSSARSASTLSTRPRVSGRAQAEITTSA